MSAIFQARAPFTRMNPFSLPLFPHRRGARFPMCGANAGEGTVWHRFQIKRAEVCVV